MSITRINGKDIDSKKWRKFIRSSNEGMVYFYEEFLSGIAPNWEAYIFSKGDEWQMVFPFAVSKKWGLKYFLQPKFTQYLGPVFAQYNGRKAKELSWKNSLLNSLCIELKKDFGYCNFNLHPDFDYPLPFINNGFRLSPRYTYQLDIKNATIEELEKGIIKDKIQIRKAEQKGVVYKIAHVPTNILSIFEKYKGSSIEHLSSKDYKDYGQLIQHIADMGAGILVEAYYEDNCIGGMILYEYNNSLTYAFSAVDPKYSKWSVGHGLIWQAIKRAKDDELDLFDFEGSMIPEIERVFRRFGAKPKTYLNVQQAKFKFLYR